MRTFTGDRERTVRQEASFQTSAENDNAIYAEAEMYCKKLIKGIAFFGDDPALTLVGAIQALVAGYRSIPPTAPTHFPPRL